MAGLRRNFLAVPRTKDTEYESTDVFGTVRFLPPWYHLSVKTAGMNGREEGEVPFVHQPIL